MQGTNSLGLIDINGWPIPLVNVVREESHDQGGVTYYYRNIYLVPDPYIRTKGYLKAKSIRVKNIPLIGRVVDIRWKGKLRG